MECASMGFFFILLFVKSGISETECGNRLSGSSGEFTTPNHPYDYPSSAECSWFIRVDPDKVVQLAFPAFHTEQDMDCDDYDYVAIYDGFEKEDNKMIARFCGDKAPGVTQSSSNSMLVVFQSDTSGSYTGFRATYKAVNPSTCHYKLTEQSGMISTQISHPWPEDGVYCTWEITAQSDQAVLLSFNMILITSDCRNNHVIVYDKLPRINTDSTSFCQDSEMVDVVSRNNTMLVEFAADTYGRFSANYTTVTINCGGRFQNMSGIITSPAYPGNYPAGMYCEYHLILYTGRTISLNVTDFNITGPNSEGICQSAFLEMRSGNENEEVIGKFCGSSIPKVIDTNTNALYMKFQGLGADGAKGFSISYEGSIEGCGGELSNETGQITSPGYPREYGPDIYCIWFIRVDPGFHVEFTFIVLDLEHGDTHCEYDFVSLYADNEKHHLLEKFCGQTIPAPTISPNNTMVVVFRSDHSSSESGFKASYRKTENSTSSQTQNCGGNLESSGSFSTPGYPSEYPAHSDCTWYLTVPLGLHVALTFESFLLELGSTCQHDNVEVYSQDELLGRSCGRQNIAPPGSPIVSQSNTMRVVFTSDGSVSYNGFNATFKAVNGTKKDTVSACGGSLNGTSGEFSSPGYPLIYQHSMSCTWVITVPLEFHVRLEFTFFDLEEESTCSYDSVAVYEDFHSSILLRRLCGHSLPEVIHAADNTMMVIFTSDGSTAFGGFRAIYTASNEQSGCNAALTNSSGSFMSPNYPETYPSDSFCTWSITVETGSFVRLSFTDFHLEYDVDCDNFDFISVYDGQDKNKIIGRFCGSTSPGVIQSTNNTMLIIFKSDGGTAFQGFKAEYVSVSLSSPVCVEHWDSPSGRISSNMSNIISPSEKYCSWYITVGSGKSVKVDIQNLRISGVCNSNYLAVYEGFAWMHLKHRFCSGDGSELVLTLNNTARLDFVSSQGGDASFTAQYTSVNRDCGGTFSESTGTITSPGFPGRYPGDVYCEYEISAQSGRIIKLNVTDFNLEDTPNCTKDYLEIRIGGSNSAPLYGQYCGSSINNYIKIENGDVYLKLVADLSSRGHGFKMLFDGTDPGCGGKLMNSSGMFSSPNYPDNYWGGANCTWVITVAPGLFVELFFTAFDLESNSGCSYDFVIIYDGLKNSQIGPRHCGDDTPDIVTSQSNILTVEFKSDGSTQGSGFRAEYVSVNTSASACGGNLTSPSGSISSKRYPNNYPDNTHCMWRIEVTPRHKIQLSFLTLETEESSDCSYDYVAVYDGHTELKPLGKYCGSTIPLPLISSQSTMMVIFTSDGSNSYRGFSANYESFLGCGGTFTNNTGYITSPQYPNLYPPDHSCEYFLITSPGKIIRLHVTDFSLQKTGKCDHDYLTIRDGGSSNSPLIGNFCGTKIPEVFLSTGHELYLEFLSDESITGRGFNISFDESIACEKNVRGKTAIIHSPGYNPNSNNTGHYPSLTDCKWFFTAPENMTASIVFKAFAIEHHDSCIYDYVAIYDGPDIDFPLLKKLCGFELPGTIVASSNHLTLHMKTDESKTASGFSAVFYGVDDNSQTTTIPDSSFPTNATPTSSHYYTTAKATVTDDALIDTDTSEPQESIPLHTIILIIIGTLILIVLIVVAILLAIRCRSRKRHALHYSARYTRGNTGEAAQISNFPDRNIITRTPPVTGARLNALGQNAQPNSYSDFPVSDDYLTTDTKYGASRDTPRSAENQYSEIGTTPPSTADEGPTYTALDADGTRLLLDMDYDEMQA